LCQRGIRSFGSFKRPDGRPALSIRARPELLELPLSLLNVAVQLLQPRLKRAQGRPRFGFGCRQICRSQTGSRREGADRAAGCEPCHIGCLDSLLRDTLLIKLLPSFGFPACRLGQRLKSARRGGSGCRKECKWNRKPCSFHTSSKCPGCELSQKYSNHEDLETHRGSCMAWGFLWIVLLLYTLSGRAATGKACMKASANRRMADSSNWLVMTCNPTGNPAGVNPQGNESEGTPDKLAVTV
jgi:hypothetical protein